MSVLLWITTMQQPIQKPQITFPKLFVFRSLYLFNLSIPDNLNFKALSN